MSKFTKKITIPETTFTWKVYKDPTYSERFPWVLEIDGDIWDSFSFKLPDSDVSDIIKDYLVPPLVNDAIKEAK